MKPILIIAPHRRVEQIAQKVVEDYSDVDVVMGLLDRAIEISKNAEKQGVEIIISRGGTASIIKKTVSSVLVVEIPVSPYDLLNAVNSAKKYGNNIIVIGFQNVIEGVELLGPILDLNMKTHQIHDAEDGEKYIQKLINSGEKIDAILGGTVAETLSKKYNIPTVLLESSSNAIDASIKEARRLLEATRREKEKTEQFKAVLNHISEGIIAINSNGEITVFNPAAGRIMGIFEKEAIGRSIDELVPETILNSVIEKNKAELGQVLRIGQAQVLANRVPIIINNKMVGAVTTIEDITKIQEYEQKIRTKLLVKGQVAKYKFSDIIGESDVLLKTKEKAKKYAATNGTVLIIGESGTGKEMFAQSIHLESERRNGPFVAVNCTAIPQNLLESELFGYQGGAFTGARKEGKSGLFTEAHGGTIFLDEIGEMSTELQVALLRVIQEREVRPVGSNKVIPIDVRIIAATNKDLLQEIQKGAFRRDLYYRLNILKLKVPALRERKEDIKLLSRYFVSKISLKYKKVVSITEGALDRLQRYSWPGNIRELENIIESLIVLADDIITEAQVDELIGENVEEDAENKDSLEIIKNKHILKVLSECGGNQTLAAKRLGISRTHLWRLINNYKK